MQETYGVLCAAVTAAVRKSLLIANCFREQRFPKLFCLHIHTGREYCRARLCHEHIWKIHQAHTFSPKNKEEYGAEGTLFFLSAIVVVAGMAKGAVEIKRVHHSGRCQACFDSKPHVRMTTSLLIKYACKVCMFFCGAARRPGIETPSVSAKPRQTSRTRQ